MKRSAATLGAALAAMIIACTPSRAAPVEYVRICSQVNEAGWYYIPGTETCLNVQTGETYRDTENGPVYGQTAIMDRIDEVRTMAGYAFEGVAVGIALPQPIIPEGQAFAITGNWGQFEGANALGIAGAFVVTDHLMLTGGVGVGLGNGTIGTRAGFNLSFGAR